MLGKEHFSQLQKLLWEVRPDYQNLGYALNLSHADVKSITQTCRHVTDDCFNDVLTEVLKRGVTQENLAKALESKLLHYTKLAEKVRTATFSSSKPSVDNQYAHE